MQITLLGQGYNIPSDAPVGQKLIELIADKRYHTFTAISAFSSKAGIGGVAAHIEAAKGHLEDVTIITGIDQKATSVEALQALMDLHIDAYIFYQPDKRIFHPKLYLLEGENDTALIIGSANLTALGLFGNVEASVCFEMKNVDVENYALITSLKSYFSGLFSCSDPNLQVITTEAINELIAEGLLPTEVERRAIYAKEEPKVSRTSDSWLSKAFPRREQAKIPKEFRSALKSGESKKAHPPKTSAVEPAPLGELVWRRNNLPSSSVQGGGGSTNPTGGLRLVQAKFVVGNSPIDQTTYFRNTLFAAYTWNQIRTGPFVEMALIPFHITIRETDHGIYELEVRHKPSGEAGQGNYTTSVSWGDFGEVVRDAALRGSTLELFAPVKPGDPFSIVIQ